MMPKCMPEGETLGDIAICVCTCEAACGDLCICVPGQGRKDDHTGCVSKQKTRRDCNRNIHSVC